MSYSRAYPDWKNYPDTSTPITEAKLDQMDQGIYDAHYNALIQSSAVGNVPLTARGVASQTADLFRVQNSAATNFFSVDASGAVFLQDVKLYRFGADVLGLDDQLRINLASDTSVAVVLKGISGSPLAQILANGQIQWGSGGGTFDVSLGRTAADTLSLGANDKLIVGTGGVQYSDGTTQTTASSGLNSGTLASRPAASTGGIYFATDQAVLYFSNGSSWLRMSEPAGTVSMWYKPDGAVPTGYVKFDGTALPASTGIYADLYAHLGNTTATPDTRGRVPVGVGTHADHATVGANDGLTVGARRIRHKHTVGNPTVVSHNHGGGSHGHSFSGSTGGGGSHNHSYWEPAAPSWLAGGIGETTWNAVQNNFAQVTGTAGDHSHGVSGSVGASGTIIGSEAPGTTGGTVGPQTGNEPTDGAAYINTVMIAKL